MIERVRYVNHLGKSVELNAAGVRLSTGELNDWELQASTLNGSVASFSHEVIDKPVAGIVFRHDSAAALAKLDELYEVAIIDTECAGMEALNYGRLIVGDWYMLCWLRGMSSDRTWYKDAADFELLLVSDIPLWTREKTQSFIAEEGSAGLDYPHDFPHDFTASWYTGIIQNASPRRSPVRIAVEGPTSSWHVRIADTVYSVSRELDVGETIIIDGRDETITHIDALGNRSNAYGDKGGIFEEGSGSFIFEPVPSGDSEIEWDGIDRVEVIVYEQRDQRPLASGVSAR